MKMPVRSNGEYPRDEVEIMRAAARLIIKRCERALTYGPDMPSSIAVNLADIPEIVERGFNADDEVLRIVRMEVR